jgi:hypothetical protein
MSLFKQKDSKVWWYDFVFQGQRYRATTKSKNEQVAKKAERSKRRQLEEEFNGIRPVEKRKRIEELAHGYIAKKTGKWAPKTLEINELGLTHVLPFFGKRFPSEITADDLFAYQKSRQSEGAAPSSINRETTLLATDLPPFSAR